MAIQVGILFESLFWESLQRKPVYTLIEFTRRAQRHVNVEEAKLQLNPDTSKMKNPDYGLGSKSQDGGKRKNDDSQGDGNKKNKWDKFVPFYYVHTELNETQ